MAVLTLPIAKAHLNITNGVYDDTISSYITVAEAMIAERCGPLESTPVTERLAGGCGFLLLGTSPAISLTSVTPSDNGAAINVADLYLNTALGIVTYNASRGFPARYYDVVYAAGRTACPSDLLMAVKEQVRAMFEASQRGDASRVGEEQYASNTIPRAEFGLSFEVSRLIVPHLQKTVIA